MNKIVTKENFKKQKDRQKYVDISYAHRLGKV